MLCGKCCDKGVCKVLGDYREEGIVFFVEVEILVWVLKEDEKVWKGVLGRGNSLYKGLEIRTCIGEEFYGMEVGDEVDRFFCGSGLFVGVLVLFCLAGK